MRVIGLLLLALPCWAASPVTVNLDAAIRPTGLVLHETITVEAGASLEVPLYLSRRGDYYAEVFLEPDDLGRKPESLKFGAVIGISRLDRVVLTHEIDTELGRGRPSATLFWFTVDRELPLRKQLTLSMQIKPEFAQSIGNTISVQVKKRPQRVRFR